MTTKTNDKPNDKPKTKLATVLSLLARKGIVLPPDFTFDKPHSLDMLIGAIESNLSAMNAKRQAPAQPKEPEGEIKEVQGISFDEGGGRNNPNRICRPVVKHLSPERAEALAQEGLRVSGYGIRTR